MPEIPRNDECRGVIDGKPRKSTKCTKLRKRWMSRPPRHGRNKLACPLHVAIPSCLPLADGLNRASLPVTPLRCVSLLGAMVASP